MTAQSLDELAQSTTKMPMDLAPAHKKLQQAVILHGHLQALPAQIALQMRRSAGGDYQLVLETYFSACLNAAKSCFYVLSNAGHPHFKGVFSQWRMTALDGPARARFNAMKALRDDDVHFGVTGAEALPKMVEMNMHEMFNYTFHNSAIFGSPTMAEHTNPDGTIVRADALQGTVGLYIVVGGDRLEATTACAWFIDRLRALLDAIDAAAAKSDATSSSSVLDNGSTA